MYIKLDAVQIQHIKTTFELIKSVTTDVKILVLTQDE